VAEGLALAAIVAKRAAQAERLRATPSIRPITEIETGAVLGDELLASRGYATETGQAAGNIK
jgi:hypothetical protein